MTDEDATLGIKALFDIRVDLHRIRQILEEEADGEQGDEEEDP
jgi:hypothetical protein